MSEFLFFWPDLQQYGPLLAQGLLNTVLLAFLVTFSALLVGTGLGVARFYRIPLVTQISAVYIQLIRSVPVIMLIILIHFAVLPKLFTIQNSFFLSAYVALSLSSSAYMAEIIRGGFHSIHQEEYDAAKSLGLKPFQQLLHVFLPLVYTRMMPALINQSVTVIKDTSLASIIGVIELTRSAEIIYERTLHEVPLLILISLIYFLLCYSLSKWSHSLEAKHHDTATFQIPVLPTHRVV